MTDGYWVTGVSSFVGYALARHWVSRGIKVVGVHSCPISSYQGVRAERLNSLTKAGVALERVDLKDAPSVVKSIERALPEVVIHHAGWVDRYAGWDYDFDRGHSINVAPLLCLMETVARVGSRGLVITGSAAEYADGPGPHVESENGTPSLPYGLSKWIETRRAEQLSSRFGVKVRVGRLFIPFGVGDTPAKVIPSVMDSLQKGVSIDLSPCEQRRDFVYVDDVVEGYDRMVSDLSRPEGFDIVNLSSGQPTRLRDVLERLADVLGANVALLKFGARPLRVGEPEECYGSNQKARDRLGWSPKSWQEGVVSYVRALLDRPVP